MRSKAIGLAATLGAVATIGLASAAHAATVTVDVGGVTSAGDHPFYALAADPNPSDPTAMAISFKVKNASGAVIDMGCKQVHAEGNAHSGVIDPSVDPIATIQAVTRSNTPETFSRSEWKGCKGPAGLDMTVVPLNDWDIFASGPFTAGNDVIGGAVTGLGGNNLQARVYATGTSGVCDFIVEGFADGSFVESSQTLSVSETGYTGHLKIASVAPGPGGTGLANCYGLVQVGNPADFVGDFVVGDDNAANTKSGITHTFPISLY